MAVEFHHGSYTARYRDEFGVRKSIGGFHTKEAADAFEKMKVLQASQAKAKLREISGTNALSLSDAIDLYISSKPIRPATIKSQRGTYATVNRELGQIQLTDVTPRLLADYLKVRAQSVAPTTLSFEKRMLKAMFANLQQQGMLATSPAASLRGTALQATTARALTRDEELQILTAASRNLLPRLLIALDAGLRLAEISSVRANHINEAYRTVQVRGAKISRHRTLPLTNRLFESLMELEEGKEPDDYLFPRKRPGSFLWEFRAKVGFHFRFHDLRHTFSTRLMEAGAEQRLRAAALGHTWITTTDRYDHVTVDHLRPYIERMEQLAMEHANQKVMQETEAIR